MPPDALLHVREALTLTIWMSVPVLGAVAVAGALAGGFATLTRLGDATGGAVPKQLAAGVALWASGGWMAHQLWQFTQALWSQLGQGAGP